MISVGSKDARKGIGLGFGGGGREMDTELEEGEACSYQNKDDYDPNIDPDIALSYLDEKLQDVLGHFQKDFEGGVSAENLGPKFGGYGSFLPTYQRSPVWSHTPRSPNDVPVEGGRCNSAVSVTVPHSVGRAPASTCSSSLPELKVPLVNDSGKQEVSKPATRVGKMTSKVDSTTKKASNILDHKTLKVRIKVGSDNLSDKKKAAIYSGLGLDDSPSCSMDDSPPESGGISYESPTIILQTMTSFLVHGGKILSPLSDDLIHLVEEENSRKGGRHVPLSRGGLEGCGFLINESDAVRNEGKVLGEKNIKSIDRYDHSVESKSGSNGNNQNGARAVSIKEKDSDALACEELVCKTLKLPILSNSYSSYSDLKKDREFSKGILKHKGISDHLEEQPNESTYTEEDGWLEKHKIGLVGKGLEDWKVGCNNIPSNKEGLLKGHIAYDWVKSDSHIKDKKALDVEVMDSSKPKGNGNSMSHEQENTRLAPGHDCPFLGEKDQMKGHDSTLAAESLKEISIVGSCVSKTKKNTHMDNSASNSDAEKFKSHKNLKKNGDRYKDFFGELDEEENQMDLLEMPSNDKVKDTNGFARSTSVINNAQDRQSAKRLDKPPALKACPTVALDVPPSSANGTISNATPASVAAVFIKENWVQCEKCHKWRILPLGKNIDDLPEKWLCRMLTWLPGLNRCSISEEETTKAVAELNQLPALDSQNNLHSIPHGFSTAATLANFKHPDQNVSSFCSHDIPGSGKKKHGAKETSVTDKGSPIQLSNSMKKSTQALSRSLNDVNNSPRVNEPDLQQVNKSNMASEKQKQNHKYIDKNRVAKSHINGGDSKHLERKRDVDQDSFRASKKIKSEGMNIIDEDWASDHSWAAGRIHPSSSSGAHTSSAGKGRSKYCNRSSKNPKTDASDRLQVPVAKSKVKAEVLRDGGHSNIENADIRGDAKKRKIREFQNGSIPSTGCFQDDTVSVKEFSDNDYKKEKKMRICRSDGKESSTSKGCGKADKASRHVKNQQCGQDLTSSFSQRSLDGTDPSKRDLGVMQMSIAATSSSSKVSGSHKTKSSFQEVKGSPVESVSSSPMRIPIPEQLTPLGGGFKAKGGPSDGGYYAMSNTRKSSNGEDFEGKDQVQAGQKGELATLSRKQVVPSDNHHYVNGTVDGSGQDTEHPIKHLDFGKLCDEERKNECLYQANGSHPRKSGKGSSQSKDKNWNWKSDMDMEKIKSSGDLNELYEHTSSFEVKPEDSKNKIHEKFVSKLDETSDRLVGKKDFTGELSSESRKRESYLNIRRCDAQNLKSDACYKNDILIPSPDLFKDCNGDKISKRLLSEKTSHVEVGSGRERPLPLSPNGGYQSDPCFNPPVTISRKGNGAGSLKVDATESVALEVYKHIKTADNQNGSQHTSSRHSGHKTRDLNAPSPLKRDSFSQAATNAVKEAKDLKHLADRRKKAGSAESTTLYFQAALKFLHGASLLETSGSESAKHNEMILSMQIYSSSAKLCEFCAHEYEKCKDMATAALAYKCMEVAYMRVVYSFVTANRDRKELQSAIQVVPLGESPSSSASDVDNLNNLNTVDKITLPKGVSSPQVAANHVIAARSQPSFARLLDFAQDVNFAMEASKNSRRAFSSAHLSMPETKHEKGIPSIKMALDYNFQDIDGFVHLVRVAMDNISS